MSWRVEVDKLTLHTETKVCLKLNASAEVNMDITAGTTEVWHYLLHLLIVKKFSAFTGLKVHHWDLSEFNPIQYTNNFSDMHFV
jgi:hypothetical protein